MPNCSRAMRMTSSVLSALLTASVLACGEKFWSAVLICYVKYHKLAHRRTGRGGDVDVVLTEREEELTYAQFPTSLAKIFRGTVLGSSLSFPSRIPLEGRTDVRLTLKPEDKAPTPVFMSEGRLLG